MVYALFCAVQVRFLFAGLLTDGSIALPDGLTYSEYARSGFFQLLAVTAINVTLFGLAITRATHTHAQHHIGRIAGINSHYSDFSGTSTRAVHQRIRFDLATLPFGIIHRLACRCDPVMSYSFENTTTAIDRDRGRTVYRMVCGARFQ